VPYLKCPECGLLIHGVVRHRVRHCPRCRLEMREQETPAADPLLQSMGGPKGETRGQPT